MIINQPMQYLTDPKHIREADCYCTGTISPTLTVRASQWQQDRILTRKSSGSAPSVFCENVFFRSSHCSGKLWNLLNISNSNPQKIWDIFEMAILRNYILISCKTPNAAATCPENLCNEYASYSRCTKKAFGRPRAPVAAFELQLLPLGCSCDW